MECCCSTFESASRPYGVSLSHPRIYIYCHMFMQSSIKMIECDQLHYIYFVASSNIFHLFVSLFFLMILHIFFIFSSLDNVHFTNYTALPIFAINLK